LFNVEQDPHERFNLRAQNPAVVTDLQAVINAFSASITSEGTFWGP